MLFCIVWNHSNWNTTSGKQRHAISKLSFSHGTGYGCPRVYGGFREQRTLDSAQPKRCKNKQNGVTQNIYIFLVCEHEHNVQPQFYCGTACKCKELRHWSYVMWLREQHTSFASTKRIALYIRAAQALFCELPHLTLLQ